MSQETKKVKTNMNDGRMWGCGDVFENPIPAGRKNSASEISDKNHWKVVLDSHLEVDQSRWESWKDEVNTLLIFCGLFSAVVTAFLVESYKFLIPPSDSSSSGSDPTIFAFNSPHVIRLNTLWFCSLVLALSTVVIGIVALQWIRNHQRYGMRTRDALSAYEMRAKALQAWHIRWVFLSLPMLILAALVLFFVGLVDFLLSLNKQVAAPVAVLVYATFAILFLTTALPSLQIFKLYVFTPDVRADFDVPTPCPFKSPQSWLFHCTLILTIRAFHYVTQKLRHEATGVDMMPRANMPLYFTFYSSPTKWSEYDTKWLRLRDMYSQDVQGNHKQTDPRAFNAVFMQHSRSPVYDEAEILKQTIGDGNPSADVLFAAYHCFREISKNALYQGIESSEDFASPKSDERNLILRGYYWKHLTLPTGLGRPCFGPPVSNLIQNPSHDLLHDENMLVFLQTHTSHNLPEEASRVISAHLCELQARILAYTYATNPTLHIQPPAEEAAKNTKEKTWLSMLSRQYIDMINSTTSAFPKLKIWSDFAPSSFNGYEVPVSTNIIDNAIKQFSMIFEQFVLQVAESEYLEWKETIYAHQSVSQFLTIPATMLRYNGTDQTPFDTFSRFEKSFEIIQTALGSPPESMDERGQIDQSNADYLFLTACFIIEQFLNPYTQIPLRPFDQTQCDRMADFIMALHAYEQTNYPEALDRIQKNGKELWSDTGLWKVPRFTCKPHPTRKTYIRWKDMPAWIKIKFPAQAS